MMTKSKVIVGVVVGFVLLAVAATQSISLKNEPVVTTASTNDMLLLSSYGPGGLTRQIAIANLPGLFGGTIQASNIVAGGVLPALDGRYVTNIVASVTNQQSISTNFLFSDSMRVADRSIDYYGVNRFKWPRTIATLNTNGPFTLWFFGNGWVWDSDYFSVVTNLLAFKSFAGFGSRFYFAAPYAVSFGASSGFDTAAWNGGMDTNWMPGYFELKTSGTVLSPIVAGSTAIAMLSASPGGTGITNSCVIGDTLWVAYTCNPTGGLFAVEVRTNGAPYYNNFTATTADWIVLTNNVSSTNATWQTRVFTWTNSFVGPMQIRVRATSDGYTPVIDYGVVNSKITNGVVLGMFAKDAGPDIMRCITNSSTKLYPIWNVQNPTCVIYSGGVGDLNEPANTGLPGVTYYAQLFSFLKAGYTNADFIDIGVHNAGNNIGSWNEAKYCYTNSMPFFRGELACQDAWGSYEHSVSIGLVKGLADPHLTAAGYNSFGELVWSWLGWVNTYRAQ